MAQEFCIAINAATAGDNQLVAAPLPSQVLRVRHYLLIAAGAVVARFQSTGSGGDLTGPMSLITGTPVFAQAPAQRENALFFTQPGDALNLRLSAGVQVSGHLSYMLE